MTCNHNQPIYFFTTTDKGAPGLGKRCRKCHDMNIHNLHMLEETDLATLYQVLSVYDSLRKQAKESVP